MGRKKDDIIWDQFEQTNDGIIKCKHCRAEFRGKPSVTRLRDHLLGVAGGGIRICTLVPEHVKNAVANASTSNKRPRIEPPSSINDNEFNRQGDNRQQTHEALQGIEEFLEGSYTSALDRWNNTCVLHDTMAQLDACRVGPGPSIDEVNNLASTSTRQWNNEFQNGMQANQEVVRGRDQECYVVPKTNGLPQINGSLFLTEDLVGKAFQENMDTVLKWLMSDEVSSIGIYGMGGVGKTTLLTHIHNRILEDKSRFGNVHWVTVSQDFSIERLQNLIAKTICLDFGNEDDQKKKAAKLSEDLKKSKVVLILDDLWNHFDARRIGIPTEANGCKLIITTRSLEVCRRTNCREKLKVEPLLKREGWELFLKTLGHDLAPEIEQIARSIVRECDGLPLGIVTMAGSMREVEDIYEWNTALTELQNSEVRQDDMEPEVFRILRFSYARLNDPTLQQCLLYSALYPEDSEIARNDLLEHLIAERIIERTNSRKASYEKGQTMLNKLVNVCLLERSDRNGCMRVKMHDLIRDMAIQIMGECLPSLVQAGKQLIDLPMEKWTENIVRVSLMANAFYKIPSHHLPKCPNLSTFLLCDNQKLRCIPESFFDKMQGLKVLDLSRTTITKLPGSVSDLENLTALILRNCKDLRYVPSLRKLGALEMLDLLGCGCVTKVPAGLESMANLMYLNLLLTRVWELPAGILRNLSHLQFLAFHYSSENRGVKGDELGCCRNLETLYLSFNDQRNLNNYIRSLSTMHTERLQLSHYALFVGPRPKECEFRGLFDVANRFGRNLCFSECIMSREILLLEDVQGVKIKHVSIRNGRSLCLKNAIDLKDFIIHWCMEIEYLFCLSSSPSIFRSLETLYVSHINKLRGLFHFYGLEIQLLSMGAFSRLREIKINWCRRMKKLFPIGLLANLQNLQVLQVTDCSKMEEIIASGEEEEEEEGSNTHFTLTNLRLLKLQYLPKLKSICNAKLKCDSLHSVNICECPELKKIPISLPLLSLQRIEVYPKEWWQSVEWGHPNNKFDLQPLLYFG